MFDFLKDKIYRKQFFIAIGFGFFTLLVVASRVAKGVGRIDSTIVPIIVGAFVIGLAAAVWAFGNNYRKSKKR